MYKIGNFVFDVIIRDVPVPKNLEKFRCTDEKKEYTYEVIKVDKVEIHESEINLRQDDIYIVQKGQLEKRYLFVPGEKEPYALCDEISHNKTIVYIDRKYTSEFVNDVMFMSLLSLEKRLRAHNQFILHCSYIIHKGEAILFTGPSGIGKSTQADLWDKYKDIQIINGDRAVLSMDNQKLYASGCSFCGTSEYCENVKSPVRAIVILDQALENQIVKLPYKDTVMHLFKQITINYYNEQFFNDAMNFIDAIIEKNNIYHMRCNISRQAVDLLYDTLYCEN